MLKECLIYYKPKVQGEFIYFYNTIVAVGEWIGILDVFIGNNKNY